MLKDCWWKNVSNEKRRKKSKYLMMYCLQKGVHFLMLGELIHVPEEETVLLEAHIATKAKSNSNSMIGKMEEGLSVLNLINLGI